MSRLKTLREDANREPDPEVRRRRIAALDKVEAEILDADKRLAAADPNLADFQSGRKRFFSWTEFVLGLGVVGALVGSFYYELSTVATTIVVVAVAFVIIGILLLRVKRRLKNLDTSA
jgi:Flp pilus assembly protein TadB